jgi:hypothetical protein
MRLYISNELDFFLYILYESHCINAVESLLWMCCVYTKN